MPIRIVSQLVVIIMTTIIGTSLKFDFFGFYPEHQQTLFPPGPVTPL